MDSVDLKYFVLADRETVIGFRLAGVPGEIVSAAGPGRAVWDGLVASGEIGVVVVTEKVAELLGLSDYNVKSDLPLVVEIPDRSGPLRDRPSVDEIVRKAVGINLQGEAR